MEIHVKDDLKRTEIDTAGTPSLMTILGHPCTDDAYSSQMLEKPLQGASSVHPHSRGFMVEGP
jgi:hypothetical protein